MIKKLFFTFIIILFINAIVWGVNEQNVIGEVVEIKKVKENVDKEIIKVKILEGKYKNYLTIVNRERLEYSPQDFDLSKGDKILIEISLNKDGYLDSRFINIWRIGPLKILFLIFLISIIVFGSLKGILSLSSLIFSGYILIKFTIPLILKGYNIMFISILSSSIIVVISFIFIAGFTKKSLVSILGTVGGTVTAGLLGYIFSKLAHITGLVDENVMFLITHMGIALDFSSLYMSSILIGSIGVIMDVSMSIVSSLFEIKKRSPNIKFSNLVHSGFHVGKDIMSTMINTLILAYVGSSMPLIMINILSETSYSYVANTELIAMEIIRSISGSIGLILTIPLTVFLAAYTAQITPINRL